MVVPNMSTSMREQVLEWMSQKDKIENEIKELTAVLTTNNVGMADPLVDDQGFPINTIDIYQVRHARHQIICLQNDHKVLMKKIEDGLHEYHSMGQGNGEPIASTTNTIVPQASVMETTVENTTPIARVNMVRDGSPAGNDGIQVNDLIVEFGSVNADNFRELTDIANVVQHSHGMPVVVKVLRENTLVLVNLTPRTWTGRGFLGCNIVPLDSIER